MWPTAHKRLCASQCGHIEMDSERKPAALKLESRSGACDSGLLAGVAGDRGPYARFGCTNLAGAERHSPALTRWLQALHRFKEDMPAGRGKARIRGKSSGSDTVRPLMEQSTVAKKWGRRGNKPASWHGPGRRLCRVQVLAHVSGAAKRDGTGQNPAEVGVETVHQDGMESGLDSRCERC